MKDTLVRVTDKGFYAYHGFQEKKFTFSLSNTNVVKMFHVDDCYMYSLNSEMKSYEKMIYKKSELSEKIGTGIYP